MDRTWVGVDVSKKYVDVAVAGEAQSRRLRRQPQAIEAWLSSLPSNAMLVMEATGGLEQMVADAALSRSLGAAVVNPRQVRDFAKATGQLAKTDRLDAQVLAEFGRRLEPRPMLAQSEPERELRALVDRRRELVETRTAEKNRRKATRSSAIG